MHNENLSELIKCEVKKGQEWKIEELPYKFSWSETPRRKPVISHQWEMNVPGILQNFTLVLKSRFHELLKLEGLKREIIILKERVNKLESDKAYRIYLETLEPEPYLVAKPLNIHIRFCEDEFIASFHDANLSTSGDTQEEAYDNLKEVIITIYNTLNRHEDSELGPGPLRQKKILNSFIKGK